MPVKTYPLGDYHPEQKFKPMKSIGHSDKTIQAINSHEFRCPKKGEWYLSGNPIIAWKAPNDLSQSYWIAKPVKVKTITTYEIEVL